MPDLDRNKITPFEVDNISFEFLSDHEALRDLAGIARVPEVRDGLWRSLPAHDFHYAGRRDRFGIGKTIQQRRKTKEMIAMTVRDTDCGQVLAARHDPLHQRAHLLNSEQSVDEDRVLLAGDQSRRCRHPHPLFFTWREVSG